MRKSVRDWYFWLGVTLEMTLGVWVDLSASRAERTCKNLVTSSVRDRIKNCASAKRNQEARSVG